MDKLLLVQRDCSATLRVFDSLQPLIGHPNRTVNQCAVTAGMRVLWRLFRVSLSKVVLFFSSIFIILKQVHAE
jgi:hypothetical protein